MKKRMSFFSLVLGAIFVCLISETNATSIFVDNFQTDLNQWAPGQGNTGTASIVSNPLGAGNALTFGQATAHIDIITQSTFGSAGGTYTLTFDYLGTCGQSNCGLFVYDYVNSTSLVSDFSYNALLQVAATGQWQSVSVAFAAIGPIGLGLEDWNGDYNPANTYQGPRPVVYLRNMQVSETPIPAALPLFATGLGALGLLRWVRKRRQTS